MNVSNTATVIDNSTIPPITYVSNPVVTLIRTPIIPEPNPVPRVRISFAFLCSSDFISQSFCRNHCCTQRNFCKNDELFFIYNNL